MRTTFSLFPFFLFIWSCFHSISLYILHTVPNWLRIWAWRIRKKSWKRAENTTFTGIWGPWGSGFPARTRFSRSNVKIGLCKTNFFRRAVLEKPISQGRLGGCRENHEKKKLDHRNFFLGFLERRTGGGERFGPKFRRPGGPLSQF